MAAVGGPLLAAPEADLIGLQDLPTGFTHASMVCIEGVIKAAPSLDSLDDESRRCAKELIGRKWVAESPRHADAVLSRSLVEAIFNNDSQFQLCGAATLIEPRVLSVPVGCGRRSASRSHGSSSCLDRIDSGSGPG